MAKVTTSKPVERSSTIRTIDTNVAEEWYKIHAPDAQDEIVANSLEVHDKALGSSKTYIDELYVAKALGGKEKMSEDTALNIAAHYIGNYAIHNKQMVEFMDDKGKLKEDFKKLSYSKKMQLLMGEAHRHLGMSPEELQGLMARLRQVKRTRFIKDRLQNYFADYLGEEKKGAWVHEADSLYDAAFKKAPSKKIKDWFKGHKMFSPYDIKDESTFNYMSDAERKGLMGSVAHSHHEGQTIGKSMLEEYGMAHKETVYKARDKNGK